LKNLQNWKCEILQKSGSSFAHSDPVQKYALSQGEVMDTFREQSAPSSMAFLLEPAPIGPTAKDGQSGK
jgi:hypothetical protein